MTEATTNAGFSLDTSDIVILVLIAIVSIYYFSMRKGTTLAHKRTVAPSGNSTVA
jgi:hypothetical protein